MADRSVDYDHIAASYDARYRVNDYRSVEQHVRSFAADPGLRVLEAGCGTGHWLSLLAREQVAVAGIDASSEMLDRARAHVLEAELVHGRAEELPWADASFDRVICINALHHFTDKAAFVSEARRVLRPGGGLMTVGLDPHTGVDRWWIYERFDGARERDLERYPAADRIRGWMSTAGFTDACTVEAQHINIEMEVRRALAEGRLDKSTTSQLVLLTDDEYQAGIARLLELADAAEALGEVTSVLSDLRLWSSIAWAR